MKSQIIVDSCCDLTPQLKNEMEIISVPLTMMVGNKEYCDDESLDMFEYLEAVKRYSGKSGSASPSPVLFQEAIEGSDDAYIVTLSSKLSGSYSNAVIGNNEAVANGAEAAFIFDSKSASAGETLIALKIFELIKEGMKRQQIIETVSQYIDRMKTYFVLEKYDNLRKNGRLNAAVGAIIHLLNIKLIMGADGNGEIALFAKARGVKNMLQQLISLIEKSGKETANETLVISHNNNPGLAEQLKELIKERFNFSKIYVLPTGGLSSLYTDDKGIVLAF